MKEQTLLRLRDRWLLADGSQWQVHVAAPPIERNARVLCDIDGAISGAMVIKGPAAHAGALIERRLRSEGLLDGESRVLVHQLQRAGESQQALYTAVPLEPWQRLQAWAEEQREHCLLFAATGLLWNALSRDGIAVLRLGRQLTAVVRIGQRPGFASAVAFSDDPADLQAAASALAEQLRGQLPDKRGALPLQLYSPAAVDDGVDTSLAQTLAAALDGQLAAVNSPAMLLRAAPASQALNPLPSRLAWRAEHALPWASAASLLLAAGLLAVTFGWHAQARDAGREQFELQRQESALTQQLPALQAAAAPQPALAPTLSFVEQIDAAQSALYPQAVLAAVRRAADGEVRILRIRSDAASPGSLQVEGRVADGRDQGLRLATFVERLRQSGYEPRAIDAGNGNRSQPTGFFIYALSAPAGAAP